MVSIKFGNIDFPHLAQSDVLLKAFPKVCSLGSNDKQNCIGTFDFPPFHDDHNCLLCIFNSHFWSFIRYIRLRRR